MSRVWACAVQQDTALAAQVDHAQFPAVQEVGRAERLAAFQGQGLGGGHGAAEHHPVHMAVDQAEGAGDEHLLHQEMPAQVGAVIGLDVFGMMGVARFHGHVGSGSRLEEVFPLGGEDVEHAPGRHADRAVQRRGGDVQRIPGPHRVLAPRPR